MANTGELSSLTGGMAIPAETTLSRVNEEADEE